MKSASKYVNLISVLALFCVCVSCRSQQAVQVVTERHDHDSTRILVDHRRDTVYIDRTHTTVQRGDTVFRTDSIFVREVTEVQVHDTTYIAAHDSVPEPVEVIVPGDSPDDPVPKFYKVCTAAFWIIVCVVALIIAIRIHHKR